MKVLLCPRCHKHLAGTPYGPCSSCREELRADAAESAVGRKPPVPKKEIARSSGGPEISSLIPYSGSVSRCRYCEDPVYGEHAEAGAHPCCATWIGEWGYGKCYSCVQSKHSGKGPPSPIRIPPRSAPRG